MSTGTEAEPAHIPAPSDRRGLRAVWGQRGPLALDAGERLPLVRRVLAARGLGDPDAASAFLNASLLGLHDPSGIPDLDRAARRILDALDAREPLAIYGDYDVDGITATATLYHTLRAIRPDADLRTYVPHRLEEGYGLNAPALAELAEAGVRVVVSVDCGITAREPARAARDLDLDLIITDHHNPPSSMDELPQAFAVVHPRRPDSSYPFGELCGAGVAYKLAWRLATLSAGGERVGSSLREVLVDLLGPVALGVIADVVPLVDENRVLARFGLPRVRGSRIEGLRALVAASGLDGEDIDAEAAGFRLGPRLNACGRMGHAAEAVELLTTATGPRAQEIAERLSALNQRRQATEREILARACEMADAAGMTSPDRRAIVLAHEQWHPGVVGIVCSRLVELHHRPVILMQDKDGLCAGSGRSVDGFNLHGGLDACADLLETFGGHDMAAGLRLRTDRLAAFVDRFTEHTNRHLGEDALIGRVSFDCPARVGELTLDAVADLARLGPFGRANPRVRLLLQGVVLDRPPARMGAGGRHAQLWLGDGPARLRAVAWGQGDLADQLRGGARVDAVVCPKLSHWNGSARVECELDDLRPLGPSTR